MFFVDILLLILLCLPILFNPISAEPCSKIFRSRSSNAHGSTDSLFPADMFPSTDQMCAVDVRILGETEAESLIWCINIQDNAGRSRPFSSTRVTALIILKIGDFSAVTFGLGIFCCCWWIKQHSGFRLLGLGFHHDNGSRFLKYD